jgi:hypothetical protein
MRVFAIQIGLADETEDILGEHEDKLVIKILDNLFRCQLHHAINSTSPWPKLI